MCSASPPPTPPPCQSSSQLPWHQAFCLVFVLLVSRTDSQSNALCRGKLGPESFKNVCTPLTEQKGVVAEDESKCIFRGEMGCYPRGPERQRGACGPRWASCHPAPQPPSPLQGRTLPAPVFKGPGKGPTRSFQSQGSGIGGRAVSTAAFQSQSRKRPFPWPTSQDTTAVEKRRGTSLVRQFPEERWLIINNETISTLHWETDSLQAHHLSSGARCPPPGPGPTSKPLPGLRNLVEQTPVLTEAIPGSVPESSWVASSP